MWNGSVFPRGAVCEGSGTSTLPPHLSDVFNGTDDPFDDDTTPFPYDSD